MASCCRPRFTTVSSTRFWANRLTESRRLADRLLRLLLLLAMCLTAPVQADTLELRDARLEATDDGWIIAADYNIELNARLEEAINKGVSLQFSFDFELARPRWYWFDEKPVEFSQTYKLSYHALTRQYRLSAGTLYQSFNSLGEALRLLSRPRLPAFERARVRAGETYMASVRMRLDVAQLPKAFQINALTSREWTLESDWKKFPFRMEAP